MSLKKNFLTQHIFTRVHHVQADWVFIAKCRKPSGLANPRYNQGSPFYVSGFQSRSLSRVRRTFP